MVGYKGKISGDVGFFFAPYIPGTDSIYEPPKPPTELQQQIMAIVRDAPCLRNATRLTRTTETE